jgi:ribosome-binding ATPase
MSLSIGIVGLPNVGKSTLFNALTNKGIEASNYPFCTIDPNVGVVKVPDKRLDMIAAISLPEKIIPTIIEFVDIAGLVKGAHKGEGLGNQFLSHIRECDAICEVVRDFQDENIIHVDGNIDPARDQETIQLELIYADLQTVEKRLERVARDSKSGDKEIIRQKALLEKLHAWLNSGKAIRSIELDDEGKKSLKSLNLLTQKPIIYVVNTFEQHAQDLPEWDGKVICLNVKQEEEISKLPDEEKKEYQNELGLEESGLDKLIRSSYELLGLITFFTTGKDETRAWTVSKGAKAPQAAGVIHTDFEKGFIRAEVMDWEKFIEAGSESAAREKGLLRIEGKDYIMHDGDICNFLFNR